MPAIEWNAALYDDKHQFVSQYGEDLISWLQPQEGENILDLGCGTGQLADRIKLHGAKVTGIDASPEMIAKAKEKYPGIEFLVKDARSFSFIEKFDAVFSNATLHWINEADKVIHCAKQCLRTGGRFVLEMGGKGNVEGISKAVKLALAEAGQPLTTAESWFFPSVSEYTTLLEQNGFVVKTVSFFERPTVLNGDNAMQNWIEMFGAFFFGNLHPAVKKAVTGRAVEHLKTTHYRNNTWYGDYVRLRVVAVKQ